MHLLASTITWAMKPWASALRLISRNALASGSARLVIEAHLLRSLKACFLWIWASIAVGSTLHAQSDTHLLRPSDRVLFLGDSNTYSGGWIEWFDAWQRASHPDWKLDVLNLGLSSETTCGLSEPSHPFPRPDVRERLGRVLDKTKPQVVVFCYGMNDAIYHPFSEDRFKTFQQNSLEAIRKIKATGARVVWISPPPFDPLPLKAKGNLRPAVGHDEYSWKFVADDYDSTMAKYAQWVMTQTSEADLVIDLHTPFVKELAERRKSKVDFSFTNDGVHFIAEGHRLAAESFIRAIGFEPKLDANEATMKQVRRRLTLLRDAYLSDIGHLRPDVPKGKPLAEALAEAGQIESTLRNSAR
jgi:lysophospholipase L1-like esterase